MKVYDRYLLNKGLKVKSDCVCPICGEHFFKRQYSQAFCCSACKDAFWNARRISKAREKYLERYYEKYYDYEHPFSSDALGQWND